MDETNKIKEMLGDLLWLNAVIATEMIQITENTSTLVRNASPPARCLEEHQSLRAMALTIAEKYQKGSILREHLTGHR
ncbi:MAG: hypothetical protein LUP99_01350 [Methanomicrobiales archaeon]|nr:hypothetical protein [Methanomicrobiales archaeon]